MILSFAVAAFASVLIWWFSTKLEDTAHVIGQHFNIPESVKGAVLYAIPSSFPEFCTVLISVLLLKNPVFSIGVGTIAGSAVFNVLLIPALSVLIAAGTFKKKNKPFKGIKISSYIFFRDGIFYLLVVILFISASIYGEFTKLIALSFLILYFIYVLILYKDTKKHQNSISNANHEPKNKSLFKAILWMLLSMFGVGIACYYLVEHTIIISGILKINPYVVAVVLTAGATSIPDTIISISAAKKYGEKSEASIVNAFASNIFDILICLSIPALLYSGNISFNSKGSILSLIFLALSTLITLAIIKSSLIITKFKSYILILLYLIFILTAFFNHQIIDFFK